VALEMVGQSSQNLHIIFTGFPCLGGKIRSSRQQHSRRAGENHMRNKIIVVLMISVLLTGLGFAIFSPVNSVSAAAPAGRGGPGGGGAGQGGPGAGNGQVTGTGPMVGSGQTTGMGPGLGNGQAAGLGAGIGLTPLSEAEAAALQEAILEEYGALNLYQSVIEQLGNVYPFSMIVRSEQQHVTALVRQAEKYGLAVPENPGLINPPTFASLADACQAGVAAEIADAALYDELKLVTTHADLLRVYDRLQEASLNQHLPAFETCNP